MLLPRLSAAWLLAATTANAFRDAYPFLLLSSDRLRDDQLYSQQISHPTELEHSLLFSLSDCARNRYLIYSQPGLEASDFASMPKLRERMRLADTNRTLVEVPAVLDGGMDMQRFPGQLSEICKLEGSRTQFLTHWPLGALPSEEKRRKESVGELDDTIADNLRKLDKYAATESYILIFAGRSFTPEEIARKQRMEDRPYEMDEPYPAPLHTDMKRDIDVRRGLRTRANGTDDVQSGLPLFETYQFLTPALFMGLTVFLALFLVLYTALSAIAGLQVTYFAFSKEFAQGSAQKAGKLQ